LWQYFLDTQVHCCLYFFRQQQYQYNCISAPPLGVFPYLAAAVGVRKAVGFAMSGHRIDVSKALEWGIVDYKVSDQDSNRILTSLSQELAEKDAVAMSLLLSAANQIEEQVIGFSNDYEISLFALNAQDRSIVN
jgi:enoyl-CoA hydratase/carnithine racemase